MIPKSVDFTGLSVDPFYYLRPQRHMGPIPVDWLRVRFDIPAFTDCHKVERWVAKNMNGRWGQHVVSLSGRFTMTVAFENEVDAVMFRLSEAHKIAISGDENLD